jgi:hypothetical protein
MSEYKSNWWTVQLPSDWSAEAEPKCTAFFADSGGGALQLSAARNSIGPVTDDDLREFAAEHLDRGAPIKTISCGDFTGFYLHYSMPSGYQRQWWLRCGDTIVFATWTSDIDQKGNEDAVVNSILDTLKKQWGSPTNCSTIFADSALSAKWLAW